MWNRRMLDFALRAGFEARLCQPYRAQTKGKVESGVKYVRRNMWPGMRFTDDADLNRQGLEWSGVAANARVHGTTYRIPWEMLDEERAYFGKLPDRVTLAPYLREDRKVARDGLVSWEDSRCGSTGNGWEGRCRWDSGWARWRSGQAMSASRCIPGPSGRGSASFSPAPRPVGKACPGGMAGPAGRRWRCRSPPVRWSAAPWTCTNWLPWEAPHDRAGTGSQAPGDPGTETSRRGPGQLPGRRRRQAADLPGDAGRPAGGGSDCSEGALPLHRDQAGPPALPAHSGPIRLRLPALHRRAAVSGNWPTWPSSPRPATSCSRDRPARAGPIRPWPWP